MNIAHGVAALIGTCWIIVICGLIFSPKPGPTYATFRSIERILIYVTLFSLSIGVVAHDIVIQ